MSLISIEKLSNAAKACGFQVTAFNDGSYLEIFAPDHNDAKAVIWGGCVYSSAEFIISDRPQTGYGYNGFFYGPFHKGMCQSDASGVRKLLSHPAMKF